MDVMEVVLRDIYKMGFVINVALSIVLLVYVYLFRDEIIRKFIGTYSLGVVGMGSVMYFLVKPEEVGIGDVGEKRMHRNFYFFLCGTSAFVLFLMLINRVPYDEYRWLVGIMGAWTGDRAAWLLKNRNIRD